MKTARQPRHTERSDALQALKSAIFNGDSARYEQLVARAAEAGATDDDIDTLAHEAMQELLTRAEQPVTARQLAHGWPTEHHFRH